MTSKRENRASQESTEYLRIAESALISYDIYSRACLDMLSDQDTHTTIKNTLNRMPLTIKGSGTSINTTFYIKDVGAEYGLKLQKLTETIYSDRDSFINFQQWHLNSLTQKDIKDQIIKSALVFYDHATRANPESVLSQISEDMVLRAYTNSLQDQYLPYETLRLALHISIIQAYALETWSQESIAL